jgi:tripartite-type tricarboxylate transporter receptor subunit TctC
MGGHVEVVVQFRRAGGQRPVGKAAWLLAACRPSVIRRFPTPTARELGADIALDAWRGVAVPKGTPPGVIALLEKSIRATVQSADFISAAEKLYVSPGFTPAAEFES